MNLQLLPQTPSTGIEAINVPGYYDETRERGMKILPLSLSPGARRQQEENTTL
jgi:hypothetical protein